MSESVPRADERAVREDGDAAAQRLGVRQDCAS